MITVEKLIEVLQQRDPSAIMYLVDANGNYTPLATIKDSNGTENAVLLDYEEQ